MILSLRAIGPLLLGRELEGTAYLGQMFLDCGL